MVYRGAAAFDSLGCWVSWVHSQIHIRAPLPEVVR